MSCHYLLCGLAGFTNYVFVDVPNAFAFVWFRFLERSDVGGYLPNELFVNSRDFDDRRLGYFEGNALRGFYSYRVAEAEGQL